MVRFVPILFALLLPACVFALDSSAGFAPGSLWLSQNIATAGDALKIYTVVYDSARSPIEGDVAFTMDAKDIGTEHFKLAAGETQIIAHTWTAVAGSHRFAASLKNVTGLDGAAAIESSTATIEVAAKTPTPLEQTIGTASHILASTTPVATSIVSKIADATESLRTQGAEYLESKVDALAGQASTPKGQVLGAETFRASTSTSKTNANASATSLWGSIKHGVFAFFLFVFKSAYLFYPFFAVIFFILLYIAKRRLSRPRY